jgi:hypothetical protein
MLTRQHFSPRGVAALFVVVVTFVIASAHIALAQDVKRSSPVADVVKGVFFDPTTYAPAVLSYDATMRDWNTSQPFFYNGFVEHNARFTISGRSDDPAVNYMAGRSQIFVDAASALGVSLVQNTTSRIVERALLGRFPEHRKAIKTVGWIQRITIASLMSYQLSAGHYRQAQLNAQRAAELGIR